MSRSPSLIKATIAVLCLVASGVLPAHAAARSAPRKSAHHGAAGCAGHGARTARTGRVCPATPRPRPHRNVRKAVRKTVHKVPRTHTVARPPVAPVAAAPRTSSPAAVIAAVLATPCQNTELLPEPANIPLVRAAVLCLINVERAEHGETPLAPNAQLEQAANEHSRELIADDYFAHVSPSGLTPVQRIAATGYIPSPEVGYVIGENLAWGTLSLSTPQAIVSAWVASPGHLANILEAQYKDTGIGVVPEVPASLVAGTQGATYAQEFGVILP